MLPGVDVNEPADSGAAQEPKSEKKPYQSPILIDWGTLENMTQAVGNAGKSDGGHGARSRTR